jgi:hypothetical protein
MANRARKVWEPLRGQHLLPQDGRPSREALAAVVRWGRAEAAGQVALATQRIPTSVLEPAEPADAVAPVVGAAAAVARA